MKATFYIIKESFNSDNIRIEDIINNIAAFLVDYPTIDDFGDENEIIVTEDVYDAQLPNGINLLEYAYNTDNAVGEEKDLKRSLQMILQRHTTNLTIEQIHELINKNSIEKCTGIISMVPIDKIAKESQIVYDRDSWYDFRRYHLGLFHGTSEYFIDECKKFYPNLFFHEHNKESVGTILNSFAKAIIFHLNGINDILPNLIKEHPDFHQNQLLKLLSKEANFPEDASVQGSIEKKKEMKFYFKLNDSDKEVLILCELHAKLCYDDSGSKKYHKDKRIYFFKGRKDVEQGKILIGHIGKHI